MNGARRKNIHGRGARSGCHATVVATAVAATLSFAGGCETPSAHTTSRNFGLRENQPVDPPGPGSYTDNDCAEGGRLWKQYCGSCHNARPLGERPFSNYHVAITHMRSQAYLTGEEYRQIIAFLRRWQDVGPATPPLNPSPKRFEFAQPLSELRGEPSKDDSGAPPPPPGPGPWTRPSPTGAATGEQPSALLPAPLD